MKLRKYIFGTICKIGIAFFICQNAYSAEFHSFILQANDFTSDGWITAGSNHEWSTGGNPVEVFSVSTLQDNIGLVNDQIRKIDPGADCTYSLAKDLSDIYSNLSRVKRIQSQLKKLVSCQNPQLALTTNKKTFKFSSIEHRSFGDSYPSVYSKQLSVVCLDQPNSLLILIGDLIGKSAFDNVTEIDPETHVVIECYQFDFPNLSYVNWSDQKKWGKPYNNAGYTGSQVRNSSHCSLTEAMIEISIKQAEFNKKLR